MSSRWTPSTAADLLGPHNVLPPSPSDWPQESLRNLFTLQLGKMLNKNARNTTPKFPYLGNKDVQWGRCDLSRLREMHFDTNERAKFRLLPGDLLVCEGGEIGRTALWTHKLHCYYQKALHRLRVRHPIRIEPCFFLHFMRFAAIYDLFADLTSQSSIAHLTREKLALLMVPVPPLAEQRKIAAILSSVDDAIEKTQAVIGQQQVVKQGLLLELLTRGIPKRHARFVQTALGRIPKEWRLSRLSDLADIRRGASPRPIREQKWFSDDGPAWVRIADATRADRLLRSTDQALSQLGTNKSVSVSPGDLIMSICGTIGKPIILDIPACIHDGFVVFKNLQKQVRRNYLYYRLQAAEQQFVERGQPGTQKNLNTTIVGRTLLPIPSICEQDEISQILWSTDDSIAINRRLLEGLYRTKVSLMAPLLAGNLRVAFDPAEPLST